MRNMNLSTPQLQRDLVMTINGNKKMCQRELQKMKNLLHNQKKSAEPKYYGPISNFTSKFAPATSINSSKMSAIYPMPESMKTWGF